eukprot:Seg286.1 transcript_id=Seg286.1/GoldUCD/mRNA.D3Y31 product="Ankyrin repeat domain-containing protein 49" protein_id=Seg286.1/GoldUCD/D3Y31
MDPINFLPESKHCYEIIDEELAKEQQEHSLAEISIQSLDLRSESSAQLGNYFLEAAEFGKMEFVEKLLQAKDDLIAYKDTDGYTALHRASYNGHTDMMTFLISVGADVAAKTENCWQPLHCACRWNHVDAALLLLQSNADINCQSKGGQTPLHLASTTPDHKTTLEMLLLQENINPTLKNGANETAFDIALRSGPHYQLFELINPSFHVK